VILGSNANFATKRKKKDPSVAMVSLEKGGDQRKKNTLILGTEGGETARVGRGIRRFSSTGIKSRKNESLRLEITDEGDHDKGGTNHPASRTSENHGAPNPPPRRGVKPRIRLDGGIGSKRSRQNSGEQGGSSEIRPPSSGWKAGPCQRLGTRTRFA